MEDIFSVAYQQTDDEKDLEYAFFGIFDGHGGREAAQFAKDNLMEYITKNSKFWSDEDDQVLKAIREGFLETQKAMWKDLPNWRKTASGLPSTAGTTASICFIKRGKLFIGHVGDSGIILGERQSTDEDSIRKGWSSRRLTQDHKPECEPELSRIRDAGGKVVSKSGVPRVVWYRPSGGHQGPVRRSTHIDEVPFLAVARALGDLWSYNAKDDIYVVSPDPDLHVYDLNILKDRCLILGTDGVWNVVSPDMAVQSVFEAERNNEKHMIDPHGGHTWINPSKKLVDMAIDRWNACNLRADNTSVVTVMLDPPGPPRAQVLRKMHAVNKEPDTVPVPSSMGDPGTPQEQPKSKGIAIISRYPNSNDDNQKHGHNLISNSSSNVQEADEGSPTSLPPRIIHDSTKSQPMRVKPEAVVNQPPSMPLGTKSENPVQCNEVSSSDGESTPPPVPRRSQNSGGSHGPRKSLSRELAALKQSNRINEAPSPQDGPSKRTRRQSGGPTAMASKSGQRFLVSGNKQQDRPLPPLPSRRSILLPPQEDSDAENNLPNNRQTRNSNLTPGPSKKTRAPEVSPRMLRPRNTPTPMKPDRKRQRSYEPNAISSKMLRTAQPTATRASTAALKAAAAASTSRLKNLRSRMN